MQVLGDDIHLNASFVSATSLEVPLPAAGLEEAYYNVSLTSDMVDYYPLANPILVTRTLAFYMLLVV